MENLKLDRPIIFFDLETTGVNVQKDRIVEISIVKVLPSGDKDVKTRLINPEMSIPAGATEVHGITDEKVKDAPTFKAISSSLLQLFDGCDLSGYNIIKYDIPLLINEFKRAGIEFSLSGRRVVDPFVIFCKKESRTLSAAYQKYCGKELKGAHGAEADTLASLDVFDAQLALYSDLPSSMDELHEYCNAKPSNFIDSTGKFKWSGDEAIIGFGKNSGTTLKTIVNENPGYLSWMMKTDFPEDAKKIAQDALAGIFPAKK